MNEKAKEEKIVEFVKAIAAIDYALEPYREQKRDLRKSFEENGWLTKEEMRIAIKAMRLLKDETDLEQLTDFYKTVKSQTGI